MHTPSPAEETNHEPLTELRRDTRLRGIGLRTRRAGEFSLHHVHLAHGSHPNTSADRRIGFAIRYIPTSVRQTKLRDAAVLVRGVDRFGHLDLLDGPAADLDEAALGAHADSAARLQAAVYSGTDKQDFRD